MWSDNETDIDLLGYHHLVGGVLEVVNDDQLLPATVGVFGDWGSGKSSLIKMVVSELEADESVLVVPFNGWLFEGYEDAKTALMGSIIDALADRKTLTEKGKSLVLSLVRRVNLMQLAGTATKAGIGYAAGGVSGMLVGAAPDVATATTELINKAKDIEPKDLGAFLKEEDPGQRLRRTVREFRDDLAGLIKETTVSKLVVVVDDLDRCSPDTVIATLEAIKLFLFVPKTAFIIGADERLVKYAVRRRFPELPGEQAEVGRDYLEKLVQFPVRIPPMGPAETDGYTKLLLAQTCELSDHAHAQMREVVAGQGPTFEAFLDNNAVKSAMSGGVVPEELSDAMALAEQVAPILAAGLLGNPRQCKRFMNTLFMRLSMAERRGITLKRIVLAKLMLLEYFRPESFKELAHWQAANPGPVAQLAELESKSRNSSGEDDDRELVEPAKSDKRATKKKTLTVPRPGVLDHWQSDGWVSEWLATEPGLGETDLRAYFYFSRDKLSPTASIGLRLSPDAQDTLAKLLGPIDSERSNVLTRASTMSLADAAGVLEALGKRARATEGAKGTDSPVYRMCDWVQHRPELFGELVTFLKSLPDAAIPFGVIPRLATLATNSSESRERLMVVLGAWAEAGSRTLRTAASTQLTKMKT